MAISYKKLWKILIDKNIKKTQLRDIIEMSNSTLAKLSKNEHVSLAVLEKICLELKCDIGDIMQILPCEEESSGPSPK